MGLEVAGCDLRLQFGFVFGDLGSGVPTDLGAVPIGRYEEGEESDQGAFGDLWRDVEVAAIPCFFAQFSVGAR